MCEQNAFFRKILSPPGGGNQFKITKGVNFKSISVIIWHALSPFRGNPSWMGKPFSLDCGWQVKTQWLNLLADALRGGGTSKLTCVWYNKCSAKPFAPKSDEEKAWTRKRNTARNVHSNAMTLISRQISRVTHVYYGQSWVHLIILCVLVSLLLCAGRWSRDCPVFLRVVFSKCEPLKLGRKQVWSSSVFAQNWTDKLSEEINHQRVICCVRNPRISTWGLS